MLFVIAALILSFSGCCNDADVIHGQTVLAYEQANYLNTSFHTVATVRCKLSEGCRDKLNMMFCVSTNNDGLAPDQVIVNDLYLLDLDTGIWYMGDDVDHDDLYIGDKPNFETKESALKYFYNAFDNARGDNSIGMESASVNYLAASEIDRVNQMRAQNEAVRVFAACRESDFTLPISAYRQEQIEAILDQPAGIAKYTVSTVAEAVTYLKLRFSTVSAENPLIDEDGGTLRSAVEILEGRKLPVTTADIATCVSYLLSDTYEIETLTAFVLDDGHKPVYPVTICAIKTADGYLFFDPLVMMGDTKHIPGSILLPEMACASIDAYVDRIQRDPRLSTAIVNIFKVSDGARVDYTILNSGCMMVETSSPGAERFDYSTADQ